MNASTPIKHHDRTIEAETTLVWYLCPLLPSFLPGHLLWLGPYHLTDPDEKLSSLFFQFFGVMSPGDWTGKCRFIALVYLKYPNLSVINSCVERNPNYP